MNTINLEEKKNTESHNNFQEEKKQQNNDEIFARSLYLSFIQTFLINTFFRTLGSGLNVAYYRKSIRGNIWSNNPKKADSFMEMIEQIFSILGIFLGFHITAYTKSTILGSVLWFWGSGITFLVSLFSILLFPQGSVAIFLINKIFYSIVLGIKDAVRPIFSTVISRKISKDSTQESGMFKKLMGSRKVLTDLGEMVGRPIMSILVGKISSSIINSGAAKRQITNPSFRKFAIFGTILISGIHFLLGFYLFNKSKNSGNTDKIEIDFDRFWNDTISISNPFNKNFFITLKEKFKNIFDLNAPETREEKAHYYNNFLILAKAGSCSIGKNSFAMNIKDETVYNTTKSFGNVALSSYSVMAFFDKSFSSMNLLLGGAYILMLLAFVNLLNFSNILKLESNAANAIFYVLTIIQSYAFVQGLNHLNSVVGIKRKNDKTEEYDSFLQMYKRDIRSFSVYVFVKFLNFLLTPFPLFKNGLFLFVHCVVAYQILMLRKIANEAEKQ